VSQPFQPWGSCLATLPQNGVIDLTPDMQVATGRAVLSQSLIRRQTTPRGSVIQSPNDCIDVRSYLNKGVTQSQLQSISSVIQQEILRDARVNAVQVTVTYTASTGTTVIQEQIVSSYGPFALTLTLTATSFAAVIAGQ
jgi:hypothetical protein